MPFEGEGAGAIPPVIDMLDARLGRGTYGVARLGELQRVGDAARIAAAALGPLPLALALSLSGSYTAGVVALTVLAAACALLGLRIPARRQAAA